MSKRIDYKVTIPLFTDEATSIWRDMPNIVKDLVVKKDEAISKFNRLDAIVNGGALMQVGTAFGQPIYARINEDDKEMAEYQVKRLSSFMGNFMASEPEEIVIDGKRYTVVLKEQA